MTIHVTISEAEKRLAELISAVARGEEVLFDRDDGPQVRLVRAGEDTPADIQRRAAKRRAAIGMFKHLVGDHSIDIARLRADDRWDEHYARKFADLD